MKMRLEEAMVFALVRAGRGMTISCLTEIINRDRLHIRTDGLPVTQAQIYAAISRNRGIFINENAIIHLLV